MCQTGIVAQVLTRFIVSVLACTQQHTQVVLATNTHLQKPMVQFFLLLSFLSSWLIETDVGKAPFLMQGTPIYPPMANVQLCNFPVPKVEDNHIFPPANSGQGAVQKQSYLL